MSLVPTWVQAVDGKFYKNPVLKGEGWFICFDDDEPPEIVVSESLASQIPRYYRTKELAYRTVAMKLLQLQSFDFGLYQVKPKTSLRLFNVITKSFERAGAFFFILRSPIPVPQQHDGVAIASSELGECTLFMFDNPEVLDGRYRRGGGVQS